MENTNLVSKAFYDGGRKACIDYLNNPKSKSYPPWTPLLQRCVYIIEPGDEDINAIYKQEALRCAISQELKQKYKVYLNLKQEQDQEQEKKRTLDDIGKSADKNAFEQSNVPHIGKKFRI
jgi:hypothetical protein